MALAEGILSVVLEASDGANVRSVDLQVGALQLVVPESLKFSFELASEGTPAHGATIRIHETPARLKCNACGAETVLRQPPFQCERCSSPAITILSGDEVVVDSVELDNGELIRRREVPANEILEEHMKEHHAGSH